MSCILKYFTDDNTISLGTGISLSGEVKKTALNQTTFAITKIQKHEDEYGYNLISSALHFEKTKNVNFGIDLDCASVSSFTKKSIPDSCTNTIKPNEVLIAAYRKIVRTEDYLDTLNPMELREEAADLLKQSAEKFHTVYGDYFVTSIIKGSALSVNALIATKDCVRKPQLMKYLAEDGYVYILKCNQKEKIKNSLLKIRSNASMVKEYYSTTVGLDNQNLDLDQLLVKIENLDELNGNEDVLYYILHKYALIAHYNRIIVEKPKYQSMMETFQGLNNEFKDTRLFDQLVSLEQQAKKIDKNLLSLVEYKREELIIENELESLVEKNKCKQSIEDCAHFIRANKMSFAVDIANTYGTCHFLKNVTQCIYENGENLSKVIKFARLLQFTDQTAVIFSSLIELINVDKRNGADSCFNSKYRKLFYLAYETQRFLTSSTFSEMHYYNSFKKLKNNFDDIIVKIVWSKRVYLRNKTNKMFVYPKLIQNKSKYVYSCPHRNGFDDAIWRLDTKDNGETFQIINDKTNEYLYTKCVDEYSPYKQAVTSTECYTNWILKPNGENSFYIYNAIYDEYLFIESPKNRLFRSNVYATRMENLKQFGDMSESMTLFTIDVKDEEIEQPSIGKSVTVKEAKIEVGA